MPLLWEQAPGGYARGEYEPLFPSKVAGGIGPDATGPAGDSGCSDCSGCQDHGRGLRCNRLAFGMTSFCMEIESASAKNAAQAASEKGSAL